MDHRPSPRPSTPRLSIGNGLTSISSPKRKRNSDSDPDDENPRASPMRFRTELPSRPRVEVAASPTSPRSKVSLMAFGKTDQVNLDSSGSWNGQSSSPTEPDDNTTIVMESPTKPDAMSMVIPSTPLLEPSKTIAIAPVSPFPLPAPLPQDNDPNNTVRNRFPPPATSSPLKSSRTSPPPPNMDLVWSASEITGHNPSDPSDDGYGINGIGFRPTPAMAHARSQRRKQQVAEWKTREAKEARQKRMDRRRKVSAESDENGAAGRRVRFLET